MGESGRGWLGEEPEECLSPSAGRRLRLAGRSQPIRLFDRELVVLLHPRFSIIFYMCTASRKRLGTRQRRPGKRKRKKSPHDRPLRIVRRTMGRPVAHPL